MAVFKTRMHGANKCTLRKLMSLGVVLVALLAICCVYGRKAISISVDTNDINAWTFQMNMRLSGDDAQFNTAIAGEPLSYDVIASLYDQNFSNKVDNDSTIHRWVHKKPASGEKRTLTTDVKFYATIRKFKSVSDKDFADIIEKYKPDSADLIATWAKGTVIKAGDEITLGQKKYPGTTKEGETICIIAKSLWGSKGLDGNIVCTAIIAKLSDSSLHTEAKVNTGKYTDRPGLVAFPGDTVWWRHTANSSGSSSGFNFELHNTYKSEDRSTTLSSSSGLLHEGYYKYNDPFKVKDEDLGETMCESVSGGGANSNEVCVKFAYHYTRESPHMPAQKDCTFYGNCPGNRLPRDYSAGLRVNSVATVDHVLVGDYFEFWSWVYHMGGKTNSKRYNHVLYMAIVRGDAVNNDNQDGPLVYPTTNLDDAGCDASAKYSHGLKKKDIKSCHSLCVHEVPGDLSTPCVKDFVGLKPGKLDGIYRPDILDQSWFDSAGAKLGDKVCAWSAIDNWQAVYGDIAPSIMVSNMICIDIAKLPQIRILGGDSISTKNILGGSYSDYNSTNFDRGSWSQYGLFAGKGIKFFGSSGFTTVQYDKDPLKSNRYKSCYLDFSNGGVYHNYCFVDSDIGGNGDFGISDVEGIVGLPLINNQYSKDVAQDSLDLSTAPSGDIVYHYTGGGKVFRLSGNLRPGAHLVVEVPKGVSIDIVGDIGLSDYSGRPTSLKNMQYKTLYDLPTLSVISHDDINISGKVKQIYANLMATKEIYTCAEVKPSLNVLKNPTLGEKGPCNQHLTVTGSLMSGYDINFHRTAGSDIVSSKAKDPSETIVYTPTNFLWPSIIFNSTDVEYRTVYATAMVPRY